MSHNTPKTADQHPFEERERFLPDGGIRNDRQICASARHGARRLRHDHARQCGAPDARLGAGARRFPETSHLGTSAEPLVVFLLSRDDRRKRGARIGARTPTRHATLSRRRSSRAAACACMRTRRTSFSGTHTCASTSSSAGRTTCTLEVTESARARSYARARRYYRQAYCDPRGGESPVRPAEPQTDVVGPQRPRWLMRVRKEYPIPAAAPGTLGTGPAF